MTTTVIDKVQEAVDRGAAWLDVRYPGWAKHIDFDDLAMMDAERCILGQVGFATGNPSLWDNVYDEYNPNPEKHLGAKFITEHGFVPCGGVNGTQRTKDAWWVAVKERLNV